MCVCVCVCVCVRTYIYNAHFRETNSSTRRYLSALPSYAYGVYIYISIDMDLHVGNVDSVVHICAHTLITMSSLPILYTSTTYANSAQFWEPTPHLVDMGWLRSVGSIIL